MKRGDLVYLRWEDSLGCPRGWEDLSTARGSACSIIESVGWVMSCGRRTVQIAPHVSTVAGQRGGCVQGHMTIPRSGLLDAKVLEAATSSASVRGRRPQPS